MPIPTKQHVEFSPEDVARFWSKVDVKEDNECWLWTAGKFSDGYGQFKAKKPYRAHRVAYVLFGGIIPDGMLICHGCDNTLCCNPSHMFVGTCAENHADRNSKGRQAKGERNGRYTQPENTARGECHGNAVLTEEIVRNIRQKHASGQTQASISRELGLKATTVNRVVLNKYWRHV